MLPNSLDQAKTQEDRQLAASVAKIPEWAGMQVTYRRVKAGATNFNYLIHVRELDLLGFAKVVGRGSEAFINRAVAHEAAVLSAETGIGPALLAYVEEDDFEVYEFLADFKCFTTLDMTDPILAGKVMDCFAKIHAAPRLSVTNNWADQIDTLTTQVLAKAADRPDDLNELLKMKERARSALGWSDELSVPCYNDGYVTNFMYNEQRDVRIIDWEYGANNDPYWDLATYFYEAYADRPTRQSLLHRYNPNAGAQELARVQLFLPMICLKWGLWASLQASISDIEFDYLKYADILFMRARLLMGERLWTEALEAV